MSKSTDYDRDFFDAIVEELWRGYTPGKQIAVEIGYVRERMSRLRGPAPIRGAA